MPTYTITWSDDNTDHTFAGMNAAWLPAFLNGLVHNPGITLVSVTLDEH